MEVAAVGRLSIFIIQTSFLLRTKRFIFSAIAARVALS